MSTPDPHAFDFEAMFDEDYLFFYGPLLEERSDADADLIERLLAPTPGSRILDLGCGHGRITNRLASRDITATVTGLDASALFLDHARADAEARGLTNVQYVLGDMRALPFESASFDIVISWFTSFGYFNDDENHRVLEEAQRILQPGGRVAIELNNLTDLLARWQPVTVIERDGAFAIDRPRLDPVSGRAVTERTIVRDGRSRRLTFSVRMFVPAELRDWLAAAGFATTTFYDNRGDPLTATSRRAIAVARTPRR
jgi:ubiquinone/menaquinone biosynthesis C-methylase UbiE